MKKVTIEMFIKESDLEHETIAEVVSQTLERKVYDFMDAALPMGVIRHYATDREMGSWSIEKVGV